MTTPRTQWRNAPLEKRIAFIGMVIVAAIGAVVVYIVMMSITAWLLAQTQLPVTTRQHYLAMATVAFSLLIYVSGLPTLFKMTFHIITIQEEKTHAP